MSSHYKIIFTKIKTIFIWLLSYIGQKVKKIRPTPAFFAFLFFAYFVYHLLIGNRGLIAWWSIQSTLKESQDTLKNVQTQILELEENIRLLKQNPPDKDFLEETAREILNITQENEIIVLKQNKER